ncbi:uncharacterized protein EI90DRAFT_2486440 [Cantharellus anzutake]|uniref:uncharacterized protein n=1 Tax=Cantharellus anzutake TaxID=1750568 RepID=UPI001903548E|nr:uncharacterized protein EI90DRAFT_2486440 [Cantharellus anzutake]KAF8321965.1 hypothetical protein EI90DRAFT_2486440 [Cantharellus anzutake]
MLNMTQSPHHSDNSSLIDQPGTHHWHPCFKAGPTQLSTMFGARHFRTRLALYNAPLHPPEDKLVPFLTNDLQRTSNGIVHTLSIINFVHCICVVITYYRCPLCNPWSYNYSFSDTRASALGTPCSECRGGELGGCDARKGMMRNWLPAANAKHKALWPPGGCLLHPPFFA